MSAAVTKELKQAYMIQIDAHRVSPLSPMEEMMSVMVDWYRTVSDPDRNPLNNLAPAQRFQTMTMLGLMWTAIFCASAGAWLWFGEIAIVHLLLALGTLMTGLEFRSASRRRTYRDYPNPDGTARYDDVWGG